MNVTSNNFVTEVVDSLIPVVIQGTAKWCGPCKKMYPIVDELVTEMKDIKFVRLDVDASTEIADLYSISSIPAFLIMYNGWVIKRRTGACSKNELKAWIYDNTGGRTELM